MQELNLSSFTKYAMGDGMTLKSHWNKNYTYLEDNKLNESIAKQQKRSLYHETDKLTSCSNWQMVAVDELLFHDILRFRQYKFRIEGQT